VISNKQTTTSLSTEEVTQHKKEVKNILQGLVVCGDNKIEVHE